MTYFPKRESRETKPEQCPGCKAWFLMGARNEGMGCLVLHGPGSCCHFHDEPTPEGETK